MTLDPEALRTEAAARLGDPRALRALEAAELRLSLARSWEGSDGPVQGVQATLGLDGASLADLDAHPASLDALEEALARAVARHRGHSLTGLALRWELEPLQPSIYRGIVRKKADTSDIDALRRALASYLDHGAPEAAEAARRASDPTNPRQFPPACRADIARALGRLRPSGEA